MEIPRKDIDAVRNYLKKIEKSKYCHYRDVYTDIDDKNFQLSTKVDFKRVSIDANKNPHWQFDLIKASKEIIYENKSKTSSQYLIDTDGNVYRLSDHWGAIASCQWTLEGEGCLIASVFITGAWELGVANLSEFKIFRRKQERRRDIILNPKWVKNVKKIEVLKKKIKTLMCNPEFKTLSDDDKQYLRLHYGMFSKELKTCEYLLKTL